MKDQLEAQIAMQEKINPVTITPSILSLIVAIPMIIAGIQLSKKRRNCLKWSSAYAWSSLGAKLINLVRAVTILVPTMQEMTRGILASSPLSASAPGIMSVFMAGGAVGGGLVASI